MKKLYSLYAGKMAVMQSVPADRIREYLGMPSLKMADYVKKQYLVRGKYRIVDEGEVQSNEKKQKKPAIPADMWKEWEEVCGRLRGIHGLEGIAIVLNR